MPTILHSFGSTIRFLHDRIKEHLSQLASSVFKHLNNCQNNVKDAINMTIIAKDTDPVNLRLKEAVYIKKEKPQLNSREERNEVTDLLF